MSSESFDFDLAEDLRAVRGAIDSQAWLLNNVHNAATFREGWPTLLESAREDAARGREALTRLESRLGPSTEEER